MNVVMSGILCLVSGIMGIGMAIFNNRRIDGQKFVVWQASLGGALIAMSIAIVLDTMTRS